MLSKKKPTRDWKGGEAVLWGDSKTDPKEWRRKPEPWKARKARGLYHGCSLRIITRLEKFRPQAETSSQAIKSIPVWRRSFTRMSFA